MLAIQFRSDHVTLLCRNAVFIHVPSRPNRSFRMQQNFLQPRYLDAAADLLDSVLLMATK